MQLYIEDMTCGSCVKHVTETIRSIDPNAEVQADVPARIVTVTSTATQEAIVAALGADGYPSDVV